MTAVLPAFAIAALPFTSNHGRRRSSPRCVVTDPNETPPPPTPTPQRESLRFTEAFTPPLISPPWQSGCKPRHFTVTRTERSVRVTAEQEPAPSSARASASTSASRAPSSASDWLARLASPLLPTGWPASVGPGYARWSFWHVGRHVFRNAHYVLGTTSLLYALGLDSAGAIAVSAAVKWVLKDGAALGTKFALTTSVARAVDASPKRLRVLGDTLMAVAASVEVLSLTHPAYFLLFGSAGALLRDAGGALSGPAYRVFLDSFARGNIGEVSSRGEAQVVIGNLAGLGAGVCIASALAAAFGGDGAGSNVEGRLVATLAAQLMLACAHLACTVRAVGCVQLATLNAQRLRLVVEEFARTGRALGVGEANAGERFVRMGRMDDAWRTVVLGASASDFPTAAADVTRGEAAAVERGPGGQVGVVVAEDARVADLVRAALQAWRLADGSSGDGETGDQSEGDELVRLLGEQGWVVDDKMKATAVGVRSTIVRE